MTGPATEATRVAAGMVPRRGRPRLLRSVSRFARQQPVGFVCVIIISVFVLVAVFAHTIAPFGATELTPRARLLSPNSTHYFGTDERGRDMFSRVVIGARVSMQVGIVAVAIGVIGGSAIGIVSGYRGGLFDLLVQRLMDALLAFPALVLAIGLAGILGPGTRTTMLALGIVLLPSANRIARGSALSVKESPYIEAARASGAPEWRIMFAHVVPNVLAPIVVVASIVMGYTIIAEAGLSFLGLGVQPPTPSWGQLLNTGRPFMEDSPWLVLFPGAAIVLVVLAFNLLGDALRDHLDPSLRQR
jgi:peptide/nickel transport system permease protein